MQVFLVDPANIKIIGDAGDHGRVCSEQSSMLATVSSIPYLNGAPISASSKLSLEVSPVANRTGSRTRPSDLLSSNPCEHV